MPLTSNISHSHILRSIYVNLIGSNLILAPESNPVEFGRNSVDSVLLPNKCIVTLPEMYTVTCGYKKKCTARCQCSKFGAFCTFRKNFASALEKNVVPKLTNRLSSTLHKICKYKSFLWVTFPHMWTESQDIYQKIGIREKPYILIFYLVWCISLIIPENYISLNKSDGHYTENK